MTIEGAAVDEGNSDDDLEIEKAPPAVAVVAEYFEEGQKVYGRLLQLSHRGIGQPKGSAEDVYFGSA